MSTMQSVFECVARAALISIIAPVIGLAGGAASTAANIPTERERFHIFLLMGQSNMSGTAPLQPGDKTPVPGVVRIPTISRGELSWEPAAHPLHNRLPSDAFGLGLPFAVAYQKSHPGITVGLIPEGWGGAAIDQMSKGTATYDDALRKVRWAAGQGVIAGVLWHQGESDTVSPGAAAAYQAKLDALVRDLRADLNRPDLPFVAGQLADFYGTGPDHNAPARVAQIGQVQQALRELPARVPRTAWVSSQGLKSMDAHMVHFDRDSYIELGKRYAQALASAEKPAPESSRPSQGASTTGAAEAYEARTFTGADGGTLLYRQLSPAVIEPERRYPLVLFLHGAGERGADNAAQLKHVLPAFATDENRTKYPCFVIAPQCPAGRRWVEVDWNAAAHAMPDAPGTDMALALALLDESVKTLPVDPSRIYVCGISMGGYGTWDAISRRPEYFAAAIPVCGGGDAAQAPKLARLPIWAFHGDQDPAVPLARTTGMVAAIEQAGGHPKMTIYPGVGHDAWTLTFSNPEVLAWLFAQRRPARFIQRLQAGEKVHIVTLGTSLTGGTWRWPDVMMEWLNREWPGQATLSNLGVGASASSHPPGNSGLDRARQAAAMKPDAVFIEFATNDAFLPYKISLADSKANLMSMINTLRAARPDVEIILQTMNACQDKPGSGNHASDRPDLAAYFAGYREVARASGLLLIDHYPAWHRLLTEDPARFDQLVPDRIHPQLSGYREILLPELVRSLTGRQ